MAFQIRRGLYSDLDGFTPAEGELLYTTDTKQLFVGDAAGAPNLVSSQVISVNGVLSVSGGNVALTTDSIPEGIQSGKKYYTDERAQDAAAALMLGATGTEGARVVGTDNSIHTGITFTYNDTTGRLTASVTSSGTVYPGVAGRLAFYNGTGTIVDDTTYINYSDVSGVLTIDGGKFVHESDVGAKAVVQLDSHHGNATPTSISFRRGRGTAVSPQPVVNGDVLNSIVFTGYDGANYIRAGAISSSVSNVVSTGRVPNSLLFETTNAQGVSDYRLRISEDGIVTIGPVATDDTGTGQLIVRQTISSATTPIMNLRTTFADINGATVGLYKQRGTQAAPASAYWGDYLGDIKSYAYVGSTFRVSSIIRAIAEPPTGQTAGSAITGNFATGSLNFGIVNGAGTLQFPMKLASNTAAGPILSVTGEISTTKKISTDVAIETGTFANTTARDAAITAPMAGMIVFISGTTKFQGYTGSAWIDLN
jgi:hypothetical protein